MLPETPPAAVATTHNVPPGSPPTPPGPTRLAAIDIGTNSIRLVVAEVAPDGTYEVLDEEREMTRLGHGLFERGRLGSETMERSIQALTKMKQIADGFLVSEVRAVATSAVRESSNGRAFCREVRRRCGLRVEVITAEEEAQFVVQSALRHFDVGGRSAAIVDIGGGSLEITLTAGTVVEQVLTLPLGAVRLTESYGGAEPLTPKKWRKLRKAIDRVLDVHLGKPPFHPEIMIGSGGTFTNLAGMTKTEREQGGAGKSVQGYMMTRADVVHLLHRLRGTPLEERRQTPGLNPNRADIIVAGAAAVSRLAKRLGTQQIVVNTGGLRDGLLLSMIGERFDGGETPRTKDRLESVRAFARKCRSNEQHCEHVAKLAGQVFDGLRERFTLAADGRELLVGAALLHDVGYLINHAKHHKHAYHLIMHGDLQGYSPREVEVIANIARYHRKAAPKKRHPNFGRLDRPDRRLVKQLSSILRVADGLDRTHTQRVRAVACDLERGGRLRLVLDAESDPRVEIWDAERKGALFAEVFDIRLSLVWRKALRRGARSPARQRPTHLRIATG